MGHVGKALEALLGGRDICSTNRVHAEEQYYKHRATTNNLDIDKLTVLEVIYHLSKTDGWEVLGDPERGFATFDATVGILNVYYKKIDAINILPRGAEDVLAALEYAKIEGASFNQCGNRVICILKDVTAHGETNGEAALRALLKHRLKHPA